MRNCVFIWLRPLTAPLTTQLPPLCVRPFWMLSNERLLFRSTSSTSRGGPAAAARSPQPVATSQANEDRIADNCSDTSLFFNAIATAFASLRPPHRDG